MNHIGHVRVLQGRYDPAMEHCDSTPLTFAVPDSGYVMLMGQATALCAPSGANEVGVVFELFLDTDCDTPVASYEARVRALEPGHGTVCMAYLGNPKRLEPGVAKIVIRASPETPGGTMSPEDFFSVSVVELEQSADIASFTSRQVSKDAKDTEAS